MTTDHLVFQIRTEADGLHVIVQLGSTSVRLDRDGFRQLVEATNRAADRIDGRRPLRLVN